MRIRLRQTTWGCIRRLPPAATVRRVAWSFGCLVRRDPSVPPHGHPCSALELTSPFSLHCPSLFGVRDDWIGPSLLSCGARVPGSHSTVEHRQCQKSAAQVNAIFEANCCGANQCGQDAVPTLCSAQARACTRELSRRSRGRRAPPRRSSRLSPLSQPCDCAVRRLLYAVLQSLRRGCLLQQRAGRLPDTRTWQACAPA
eukprot:SAG11_NODE_1184_length_5591_cov_3.538420_4_plen_199_part_00